MDRLKISLLLASAWALGLAGLTFYTPAMVSVQNSFAVTESLVKLSVSFFILAKAVSMFLSIPFADRFKRRTLFLLGLGLFTVGTVVCAFSNEIHIFLVGRFLEGLGVSFCILMGRSIVNDLFEPKTAVQIFSLIFIVNALAVSILPLLSSLVTSLWGWRAIFISLSVYSVFTLILCYFYLPSYKLQSADTKAPDFNRVSQLIKILSNSQFLKLALLLSLMDAGEKVLSANLPFLIIKHFNYSIGLVGALQAWLWCAHLVGLLLCAVLVVFFRLESITRIGGVCTAIAVFFLFLTKYVSHDVLILFTTGAVFYMLATGFILASCLVRIVRPFPDRIGLATALAMTVEFLMGFVFTALSGYLHGSELSVLLNLLIFCGLGVVVFSILA